VGITLPQNGIAPEWFVPNKLRVVHKVRITSLSQSVAGEQTKAVRNIVDDINFGLGYCGA
jgi:hypothetical protein